MCLWGDEAGADKDADARAGRVRAFAAQRLREHAGATLLSVTGAARDLIVEEIRAYGSSAIVGASPVSLGHGQIMVAHVEQGSDGPVVVAVETHSVTTKTPPSRRAKPPGGTESPAFHQRRGRPRHQPSRRERGSGDHRRESFTERVRVLSSVLWA